MKTINRVFAKPCPQKGIHKNLQDVFQTFQFRLKLIGTKPRFAEIFRYDISEAQIIQNRRFMSTLQSSRGLDVVAPDFKLHTSHVTV